MSCQKQIVIIANQLIIGSLGTEKYFVPYYQYCFEDTSMREVECSHCSSRLKMEKHYRVIIDDEDFYIPETIAAMSIYDLKLYNNSFRARAEKLTEQPADYQKVYKELTGIDLKAADTVLHNGYDLWKLINKIESDEEVGGNGTV